MNGVLVVDKPPGPTSHDVVGLARRALGTSRIGHTGTLDPLATGVLPLVVGRATRLAQFLSGDDKEYDADVRFGLATPTYDADDVRDLPPPPPGLDVAGIESALSDFRGTYLQTPPPFSAKKIGGVPAYKLARRNKPVAMAPVAVTVHRLTLERYEAGLARLRVVCSSGFYVRSLAHGLGERLGCGAHLEALRRTRAGEFTLDQAVPLEVIEELGPAAATRMVPMAALLPRLPPVVVTDAGARRAAHGNALTTRDLTDPLAAAAGSRVRMIDLDGTLLGIAEPTAGGVLRPVVVLV
jgi:tRNA pseudouridine55 synthase